VWTCSEFCDRLDINTIIQLLHKPYEVTAKFAFDLALPLYNPSQPQVNEVKEKEKTYSLSLTVDKDERIVQAECTCNWHQQNKLFKGVRWKLIDTLCRAAT